nr:hypothetical protein [Candidatus Sigynarchaeum springense]MDO8115985.1 hypothetical protein [Candidatus Sigynarchaeota archaeon]
MTELISMSSTIPCPSCKFPRAVKDDRSGTTFCASCGLFEDPFYTWKKNDVHSLVIPWKTSIWFPLVLSASLKEMPVSFLMKAEHQDMNADPKWGAAIHGYLARPACDADRGVILHKKICDAVITDQPDDLISMSVELEVEKDLKMLIDVNNIKMGMAQAAQSYDGVITRKDVLGKMVAAIHVFDLSRLVVKSHVADPPVSPKKAFDDQAFMSSLKKAW